VYVSIYSLAKRILSVHTHIQGVPKEFHGSVHGNFSATLYVTPN